MTIDERDLRTALEHPRGTERRTLLPYRDALNDLGAYARLPVGDRDVIVRWTEIRRRLKQDHGLDHDDHNLVDPLVPYATLRSLVLAGEAGAAESGALENAEGDLRDAVRTLRASAAARRT